MKRFPYESKQAWTAKLSRMKNAAQKRAKSLGVDEKVRSGLELNIYLILKHLQVTFDFEAEKIPWVSEPEDHIYTPDFRLTTASGKIIYIETKGRMDERDRYKHLMLRKQHPGKDIRLVFSNPNTWDRAAKTRSYGKWATANGIPWTSKALFKRVILEWLKE